MKLLIAGSRTIAEDRALRYIEEEAKKREWNKESISLVISGHARGPDRAGERWALNEGIPIKCFIPKWDFFGRAAGMIRNREMAECADVALVLWDGSSAGTKNTINTMKLLGKEVIVVVVMTEGMKEE